MADRHIHFVGSIGLEDAETVFRALGEAVGTRAPRYPDGEPGARDYWIRWQKAVFDANPVLVPGESKDPYGDRIDRPYYRLRDGVSPEAVEFGPLGYAAAAAESYAIFRRLKEQGAVPPATRFQVSLPSAVAVTWGFVVPAESALLEPAYERAMLAEAAAVAAAVPADELAIQWDVCQEVLGADGGIELFYDDGIEGSLARLARLSAAVPEAAQLGFHLCYGDPGHKHIIEPRDTATTTAFANGICAGAPRRVDWIHLPAPRDRDDEAYYAPLAGLELAPETELILGLVHHTDGIEGTRRRMDAAIKTVDGFGVATECGFGRRDPATIPELLKIHVEAAGH